MGQRERDNFTSALPRNCINEGVQIEVTKVGNFF